MYRYVKTLGMAILILGLAACASNEIIGEQPDSRVQATEANMYAIGRAIIHNLSAIFTIDSEAEAEQIIRRNIIAEDVYYRGFLDFFEKGETYHDVSVQLTNESVTNLNPDNQNTIGTILYTFDIAVEGINSDGSRELIGQADDLMVQIANYDGHFRMIEIRRK